MRHLTPILTPVASAVAVLALSTCSIAQAQQADAKPADAPKAEVKPADTKAQTLAPVMVTGIRGSVQQSLTQKRNSDGVVEVITAEDVGKMPDKNVADSLQRVPGVNVATSGGAEGGFGENDRVSLRGTPSALTLTTLNGHSVSSGDWFSDNIVGGGRSVSYSLLPSELIGRVTVHKSAQADVLDGGATGVVDIETRKPLDFKERLTSAIRLDGVHSSLSGKTDPQVSGMVNWKNDQGTLGVLVHAFHEKRHLRRDGQEFLWWGATDNTAVLAANPGLAGKAFSFLTGSVFFEQERTRQGGLLGVQFKPSSDLTLGLDMFASRLNAPNVNHNYMQNTSSALNNGISPTSYTVSGSTVTSVNFANSCPIASCANVSSSVQDIFARPVAYSDSKFINFDVAFKASDKLSFTGKLGTTRGTGHTESVGFEVWSPWVGGSYALHGLGSTADVVVPGSGTYSNGGVATGVGTFGSAVTAIDKETYAQVDATYRTDLANIPTVKVGLRHADHERSLEFIPIVLSPAGALPSSVPLGSLTSFPSNFGSTLDGGLLKDAWTLPLSAVADWAKTYTTFTGHGLQNEFRIKEPTTSGYLMANLDSETVQGNFGVRLVRTTEKVGINELVSAGVYAPKTVTSQYTDVLPSANFKVDLSKELVGRVAMSRTMARPELGQMAGLDLRDIQGTGTVGNNTLKPIRSTNADVGLEWYFAPRSMLSGGVYAMNFESYVTFGAGTGTYFNASKGVYQVYNVSQPVNTTARVFGVELAYVQALPGGFGVNANYTYADGKETGKAPASACATTGNCDMIGTSKNSYNLGGYFENDRFSARVAYNYRSTFLNGTDRNSAIYQHGVGTLSAALAYNVNKDLTLSLEGKDLNDPLLKSYASTPDQPRAFYRNGRQIYFGLRAKI
jgi:iron complex outermembrane recepter protein